MQANFELQFKKGDNIKIKQNFFLEFWSDKRNVTIYLQQNILAISINSRIKSVN